MAELQVKFQARINLFIDIGKSSFEDGEKKGRLKLDKVLEDVREKFPEVFWIESTEILEIRQKPESM